MSQRLTVNFSLDKTKFVEQIRAKKFSILKIVGCSTGEKSLELLFSPWFLSDVIALFQLLVIKFKVDKKFEENFNENFYEKLENVSFYPGKSLVILFKTNSKKYHCKFFWKVSNQETFYSVDINKGSDKVVAKYFLSFLICEIRQGKSGELFIKSTRTNINFSYQISRNPARRRSR